MFTDLEIKCNATLREVSVFIVCHKSVWYLTRMTKGLQMPEIVYNACD